MKKIHSLWLYFGYLHPVFLSLPIVPLPYSLVAHYDEFSYDLWADP